MAGGGRAWGGDLTFFKNLPSNSLPQANNSSQMQPNLPGNLSGESPHFVSLNIPFLVKGKGQVFKLYTVILANEPYTDHCTCKNRLGFSLLPFTLIPQYLKRFN